jgi:hypothetical protein
VLALLPSCCRFQEFSRGYSRTVPGKGVLLTGAMVTAISYSSRDHDKKISVSKRQNIRNRFRRMGWGERGTETKGDVGSWAVLMSTVLHSEVTITARH